MWLFLVLVFAWRLVCMSRRVQLLLHRFHGIAGMLAPLLQWYSIFFGCTCCMTAVASCAIWEYLFKYTAEGIHRNFRTIWQTDHVGSFEDFEQQFHVPTWLGSLCFINVKASMITVALALVHVQHFVRRGHALAKRSCHSPAQEVPWMPSVRENMVLLVITMPVVFTVQALRTSSLALGLMTGESLLGQAAAMQGGDSWVRAATVRVMRCRGELDLAAAIQYYAVYSFARLCVSFLTGKINVLEIVMRDSEDQRVRRTLEEFRLNELKSSLNWAAFLGVFAFIIGGSIKSGLDLVLDLVLAKAEVDTKYIMIADSIDHTVVANVNAIFMVLTIICVINMFIIGRMQTITETLGNVNLKFLGTRLLVLVAQFQTVVISSLTQSSAAYVVLRKQLQVAEHQLGTGGLVASLEHCSLSVYQAMLLHASLLGIECLVVVTLNYFTWSLSSEAEDSLFIFDTTPGEEVFVPDIQRFSGQPLRAKSMVIARSFWSGSACDAAKPLLY